jgi:hypothetical protein
MGILLAFAVGYAVGARAGSQDFDDIVRSFKSVRESEEFADLVGVIRTHMAHTLREVASLVDGAGAEAFTPQDLVERVKGLVRRD